MTIAPPIGEHIVDVNLSTLCQIEPSQIDQQYRYKLRYRSFKGMEDVIWECANHKGWCKWAWYTLREMTHDECIFCAGAPTILPTVIPEKHHFESCAKM